MKAKTKPVKGSARTQKFDRGGTVAALAGLGTLAYLMSRKKKGADGKTDSKSPMSGPVPGMQGGQGDLAPSMVDTTSKVDEAAKRRAMAASMGRPEMGDATNDDITTKKTTTPAVKTTRPAKPAVKATAPAPKSTLDVVKTLKPGERGQSRSDLTSKPYPEKEAEANKVKNTPGVTVMKPSDKEIRDIKAKQAAPTGARRTRYAKKEVEEIKSNTGPKRTRYGKKDGGAVKKYADGGMTSSKPAPKKAPMPAFAREAKENRERDQRVKKEQDTYQKGEKTRIKDQGSMFKSGGMTASKRGDGIAMRGKTKGKMY
jgi:hypothetical protein